LDKKFPHKSARSSIANPLSWEKFLHGFTIDSKNASFELFNHFQGEHSNITPVVSLHTFHINIELPQPYQRSKRTPTNLKTVQRKLPSHIAIGTRCSLVD
jgi:hypothetical protein